MFRSVYASRDMNTDMDVFVIFIIINIKLEMIKSDTLINIFRFRTHTQPYSEVHQLYNEYPECYGPFSVFMKPEQGI